MWGDYGVVGEVLGSLGFFQLWVQCGVIVEDEIVVVVMGIVDIFEIFQDVVFELVDMVIVDVLYMNCGFFVMNVVSVEGDYCFVFEIGFVFFDYLWEFCEFVDVVVYGVVKCIYIYFEVIVGIYYYYWMVFVVMVLVQLVFEFFWFYERCMVQLWFDQWMFYGDDFGFQFYQYVSEGLFFGIVFFDGQVGKVCIGVQLGQEGVDFMVQVGQEEVDVFWVQDYGVMKVVFLVNFQECWMFFSGVIEVDEFVGGDVDVGGLWGLYDGVFNCKFLNCQYYNCVFWFVVVIWLEFVVFLMQIKVCWEDLVERVGVKFLYFL